MPARPTGQPVAHQRCLVRGVVVHDQLYVQVMRHGGHDLVEETRELGRWVPPIAFADNLACGDVEGRKQRRCALAFVVVSPPRGLAEAHRQHRLAAITRLDLRLFIHTQHGCMGRGRYIKASHVVHLGGKVRVAGRLAPGEAKPASSKPRCQRHVRELAPGCGGHRRSHQIMTKET
jgi:hypothetical protein